MERKKVDRKTRIPKLYILYLKGKEQSQMNKDKPREAVKFLLRVRDYDP